MSGVIGLVALSVVSSESLELLRARSSFSVDWLAGDLGEGETLAVVVVVGFGAGETVVFVAVAAEERDTDDVEGRDTVDVEGRVLFALYATNRALSPASMGCLSKVLP